MKELKEIIHAFEQACKNGQKAALATVVHVEGSAYRGTGARMLITEDGLFTGAISGGCLESDALRKALMVMMQEKPLLATYNTSDEDDGISGVATGCNGTIRVLIEPIETAPGQGLDGTNPVALLKNIVLKRQASVLVTFFSLAGKRDPRQGVRLLVKENGELLKSGTLPVDEQAVLKDVAVSFKNKRSVSAQYPREEGAEDPVFALVEYVAPNISLIVAGAGNDVLPLSQMCRVLGWDLTLADGRPNYASAQRFPDCRLIVSEPETALRNVQADERTAAVLMTHNYNYDKSMLRALLSMPVNYIGMLGPGKKLERLLGELEGEGLKLTPGQRSRIYSPVGLDTGAGTAEEIALAILAEIKTVFAGRSGTHLRDHQGHIHHREAEKVDEDT